MVGVKERVLANADTPWTSFNELRKVSELETAKSVS